MLINEIQAISVGLSNDAAIIASEYRVLAETNEYPMLYTGINAYNSRIVGSFIEEDEDDWTVLYYIHFVLKTVDYTAFSSGRITYREIFQLATRAYIVQRDFASFEVQNIVLVDASHIGEEYWPHPKSHFPRIKKAPSLNYSISLNGGLADKHQALLSDSIAIQQAVSNFLEESIDSLPNLAVTAEILELAPAEGSFKFFFSVNIRLDDKRKQDIFYRDNLFGAYQNELIEYAIKYLPSEVSQVYYGNEVPQHFSALIKSAKDLYAQIGQSVDEGDLLSSLKETVQNIAENLVNASKSIGTNYNSIDFNITPGDESAPVESLGSITESSRPGITSAVDFITTIANTKPQPVTDSESQKYSIRLYNLNKASRRGGAVIVKEDGTTLKFKTIISGSFPLEETKFTQSLHSNVIIDVLARATRIGDKLTRLIIES
jgi:hypothetical protein